MLERTADPPAAVRGDAEGRVETSPDIPGEEVFVRTSVVAATLAFAIAVTGLAASVGAHATPGARVFAPWRAMAPLSALCIALLSFALVGLVGAARPSRRGDAVAHRVLRASRVLALACLVAAAWRLGLHALGWPTLIDVLWHRVAPDATPPAISSPATGVCVVLLSIGMLLVARPRPVRLEWLPPLAAMFLGWLGISRVVYGGAPLLAFATMSAPTSTGMIALALGLLVARPDGAIASLMRADTPGGVVARRLLPVAVVVPLLFGWLQLAAYRAGTLGVEAGVALFATTNVLVVGAVAWSSARRIDQIERLRREAEARAHAHAQLEQAHERLLQSERHARELDAARAHHRQDIDWGVPAMMHSIDARGVILAVSDTWLDKLGYERAEVVGRPSLDFFVPESRPIALDVVRPAFYREGRCDNVSLQMQRKDGGVVDIRLSSVLHRDARGAPLRAVSVMHDVSDLRRRESELARAQAQRERAEQHAAQLDLLLAERGELLMVLAHEVRQPLNNASAALQGARSALSAGGDRAAEAPLVRAQAVIDGVGASLDNTLAVAALLVAGEARSEDTDVDTLVSIVLAGFPAAARERLQVVRETATRTASFDLGLMRLALRNLLANALAYAPAGTPVTVRILDSDEPLALVLEVESGGPAIADALVPRLFERGVRAKGSNDKLGGGLGLFIVRRVMELHGGHALLALNEPEAVVFRLVIPQALAGDEAG